MKFGCLADVHLGQGVERYGSERLADQLDVLGRACDLFRDEAVDAVLFGGDLFEGPLPTPEQYVGAAEAFRRLGDIPVIACLGNGRHDAAMRPRNALEVLATYATGSFTVHSRPGITYVGEVGVAVLPWTPISRLVASRNGSSRDAIYEEAAALLLSAARGLRAEIADGPAVLLAHWSVSGAVTPTGREAGPDFGVVLDAGELEAMGWDAVVLGHLHKPQYLGTQDASAPLFYVSSPLPLNHGESGCEHGVWIVDFNEPPGSIWPCAERFVPLESRPFVTLDYALLAGWDGHPPFDPLRDELSAGVFAEPPHGAIVRVRYTATAGQAHRIDHAQMRAALLDAGAWRVTIEPEIIREDRARVHVATDALSELEALDLYLSANDVNGDRAGAMRERTARYLEARA